MLPFFLIVRAGLALLVVHYTHLSGYTSAAVTIFTYLNL